MRLLHPHMRKRSGKLSGKGAPGSARSAILNYLAALEPLEFRHLLQLSLEPVAKAVLLQPDAALGLGTSHRYLFRQYMF